LIGFLVFICWIPLIENYGKLRRNSFQRKKKNITYLNRN
jgi:hypothetical protein